MEVIKPAQSNAQIIIYLSFAILFYVLLSAIQVLSRNPIVPGASIAISMIIPVLAGVLLGRWSGTTVGIIGTSISSLLTNSTPFEAYAIIPNAIAGYLAGYLTDKHRPVVGSLAIISAHALNIFVYITFGLLSAQVLTHPSFYIGLGFEIIMGIFGINILVLMYEQILENQECRWCRW